MNKVFLGLILTVCVLGMALVMLNDRLGRKAEPRPSSQTSQAINDAEMAINARAMELAEAARALAPPVEDPGAHSGPAGNVDAATQTDLEPARSTQAPEAPAREEMAPPKEPEPRRPIREEAPKVEAVAPRPVPARAEAARPEQSRPEQPKPETPKPAPAKPEPRKPDARPQEAKPAAGARTADRFVVFARDKGATVRMGGRGKMAYSSMTLENPDRVVVDLDGDWKFPPNLGIPKNDLVSAVRVGQNGDKTRLVIDLKQKPRKVVLVPFKGGDGVDVRVDK